MISAAALGLAISLALTSSVEHLGRSLELRIDDCVDADREEVVRLVQIELGSATGHAAGPRSITITCTAEPDVVKVNDPKGPETSSRLVDLRALGGAERRARARELALVIRELLDTPLEPPTDEPEPPPALAPPLAQSRTRSLGELSLLASAEKYSAGYLQLGPSLGLRLAPLQRLVLEARLGARFAPTLRAHTGGVSAHAFVGALGLGLDVFPDEVSAGLVLLGRLQSDLVFSRGTSHSARAKGLTDNGFALIGSAASSAWLALGPRFRITLEPALLVPLQKLVILDGERTVSSIAGIGAAASLGLSLKL